MTRPNLPPVIGLSGYAQSGKDTVAQILVSLYDYHRVAFADILKDMAKDIRFPIRHADSWVTVQSLVDDVGWEEAKKNPIIRQFLQDLGVAARNHLYDDVWVEAAVRRSPSGLLVFSDMRFPNEFAKVKDLGGQTWRIMRPGVEPVTPHVSETALDRHIFDDHLYNDGTQLDLADKVVESMDIYLHYRRAGERVVSG